MTGRIEWIDALKGFAIFTVVLGHCITDALSSNTFPAYLDFLTTFKDFIYCFHMPLFFTISGYLFFLTKSYKKYKSKVLDFFLIYLIWCTLTWLSKYFAASSVNNPVTIYDLISIFWKPLMVYWYLYSLILMYLVFSIFHIHEITKQKLSILLIFSFLIHFLNIKLGIIVPTVYHMYFFALGGYLLTFNFKTAIKTKTFILFIILLFINCFLYLNEVKFSSSISLFKNLLIANIVIFLCFYLFNNFKYRFYEILDILGFYSLHIYVIHCFFTAGMRILLQKIDYLDISLYFISSLFLGILMPILIGKICDKNVLLNFPFAPFKAIQFLISKSNK